MNPPIDHSTFPAVNHLVVLRPLDAARDPHASASLMLALMSKAGRLTVVENAPAVMVELHRGAHAIVLADSLPPATRAQLIAAATRFYPRVSLWQVASHDGAPSLAPIVCVASVSATSSPHHALEDLHPSAPSRQGGASAAAPRSLDEALVTEEELAMLMSPLGEGGGR